jgi:hypothetical protein
MTLTIAKQTLQIDDLVTVVVSDIVANADATGFVRKFDFFVDALEDANRSPVITIICTAVEQAPLLVTTPTLSF